MFKVSIMESLLERIQGMKKTRDLRKAMEQVNPEEVLETFRAHLFELHKDKPGITITVKDNEGNEIIKDEKVSNALILLGTPEGYHQFMNGDSFILEEMLVNTIYDLKKRKKAANGLDNLMETLMKR